MKRFLIILTIIFIVIISMLFTGITYIYHHQDKIIPLIEAIISRSSGLKCQIAEISLSFKPMSVNIKGLSLEDPSQEDSLKLMISYIFMDMELLGRPWKRRLIIKEVQLNGISGSIKNFNEIKRLMGKRRSETVSHLGKVIKWLMGIMIFRDFEIKKCILKDLQFNTETKNLQFKIKEDEIIIARYEDLEISGTLTLLPKDQTPMLIIPSFILTVKDPFSSLSRNKIYGSFSGNGMLNHPSISCELKGFKIPFLYLPSKRTLNFTRSTIKLSSD